MSKNGFHAAVHVHAAQLVSISISAHPPLLGRPFSNDIFEPLPLIQATFSNHISSEGSSITQACNQGESGEMQSPDAERTWKSVVGDHIKDEGLKKIFTKVHPRLAVASRMVIVLLSSNACLL